ncbi:hypothetical protein OPT61_g9352 [Boeremia exigua]|uniref:Uncharacterized protein n=1 Tax=Boeremia exigua TaxID=749465 RepID=A0ACC2HVB3_9PLEO|nr:hypothetical protein OPT61_g9352 [Boeremia exigua]
METAQSYPTAPMMPTGSLAELNKLCRRCKSVADIVSTLLPHIESWRMFDDIEFQHYACLRDIIEGVKADCHLCHLVAGQLHLAGASWVQDVFQNAEHGVQQDSLRLSNSITSFMRGSMTPDYNLRIEEDSDALKISKTVIDDVENTKTATSVLHGREHTIKLSISKMHSKNHPQSTIQAQLSRHIGSTEQLQMIRGWLAECADSMQHRDCNSDTILRKPTWLLDLGNDDTKNFRLVDGTSIVTPYAALSYSWGTVQQLQLVPGNLEEFKAGIRFEALSKVTQDAVIICRELSVRYLWVDALCIIQGLNGDFQSEAPRMQEVYARSCFTIVAASIKDNNQGFLTNRSLLFWSDCRLLTTEAGTSYGVRAPNFCGDDRFVPNTKDYPGSYHIDSRAWFFQERFLSPRSIFFGKRGIHWECRQGLACEHFPDIKSFHGQIWNSDYRPFKARYAEIRSDSENRAIWSYLLEAYTRTCLTYTKDRLLAISGVASVFGFGPQRQATYGLSVDDLISDLLWRFSDDEPNDSAFPLEQAPSWSWVKSNGRGICKSIAKDWTDNVYSAAVISRPADTGFTLSLEPPLTNKCLIIRGQLILCTVLDDGQLVSCTVSDDGRNAVNPQFAKPQTFKGEYHQDDNSEHTYLYCLLVRSQTTNKTTLNYGLVLAPVHNGREQFQRVGVFEETIYHWDYPHLPEPYLVEQSHPTRLWAPLTEEKDVSII